MSQSLKRLLFGFDLDSNEIILMIDSLLFWLLLLFVSNLILIVIFWNNYGSRIQLLISRKEEKQQILGNLWLICDSFQI